MTRFVAFLRAVNVAGHARVKMSDVRDAFTAAGGTNVTTVIQSGNVLFESPARAGKAIVAAAKAALGERLGEAPEIVLRTSRELLTLTETSPFSTGLWRPAQKLYVVFLTARPRNRVRLPLIEAKEKLEVAEIRQREIFVISGRKNSGFFGFPNRFVEAAFGVHATSRNWSTIAKIDALLRAREHS